MPFANMHIGHSGAREVGQVKCPKCGFVTFPDPAECKKCGYRFAPEARRPQQTARSVTFRSPARPFALSPPENPRAKLVPQEPESAARADALHSVEPEAPIDSARPAAPDSEDRSWTATQPDVANPWHEEIAARVARYKRRRGREDRSEVSSASLRFDFDDLDRTGSAAKAAAEAELKPPGRGDDLQFDLDASGELPRLDPPPDQHSALDPHEDPAEWALEPLEFRPERRPVEIVLQSGEREEDAEESPDAAPKAAPLGRRIAAGTLDALVLLIAGAVFFLIFRASGGRMDRQPASLVVVGFAVAFLVAFYFSAFTALAFATPGQSAVGLRVKTLDGDTPGVRASLWRGIGYLVSAVSLMLGFAWAAFDPERLTWHDRMSRTCLVERG